MIGYSVGEQAAQHIRQAATTSVGSISQNRKRFSQLAHRFMQAGRIAQSSLLKRPSQWMIFSRFNYKVELAPKEAPEGLELATFAGGCFWGLELAYQRVQGVVKTSVGYTGGNTPTPTYETVCMGMTGHAEAVQVTWNPKEVSYNQLLDVFFQRVDVTTLNRQGNDVGTQYRSAIYYHNDQQKEQASQRMAEVDKLLEEQNEKKGPLGALMGRKKVVTQLEHIGNYYLAEGYHQQYLEKGGRFNQPQSAAKGCTDTIRCYG